MIGILVMLGMVLAGGLLGAGIVFLTELILRLTNEKKMSCVLRLALGAASGLALIVGAALTIYLSGYRAEPKAMEYLKGSGNVTVTKEDNVYFFDGSGSDKAMIFYPGAMVQAAAYSELMCMVAEEGIDAFLVEMPLNLAILGEHMADSIIKNHSYKEWFMSGHSLGGAVASEYCSASAGEIEGMIFLASYPMSQMSENIAVCLIYGDNDMVLSRDRYEESRAFFQGIEDELCIRGGNHSQFGSYGFQKGDGAAEITPEEQKRETADEIKRFSDNI